MGCCSAGTGMDDHPIDSAVRAEVVSHLAAIEAGHGVAPMRFAALVAAIVTDAGLRAGIEQLLVAKRGAMEFEVAPSLPAIDAFIDAELTRLEATPPPASDATDFSVLDRLLMDTVLRFDVANPGASSC